MTEIDQHQVEIKLNLARWERKPVLRHIYAEFYRKIAKNLAPLSKTNQDERQPAVEPCQSGLIVELGSGNGHIKNVIPNCIRTDIFPSPWLDQVENAYSLSFADQSVSNLILFDVFHHLQYPGTAFQEFFRVLMPGGRIIIFEPCISWLGRLVYGPLHHEPLALAHPIEWFAPKDWMAAAPKYYAAQSNASRIFLKGEGLELMKQWTLHSTERLSALSYVASGGYSKPQLYPAVALKFMQNVDCIFDCLPSIFATRLLVTLEKPTL